MKEIRTAGEICIDREGLAHVVADVVYIEREDGTFTYEFYPRYEVIDLLVDYPAFQGIPGLNLSLRRTVYRRDNRTPVFIEERSPAPNRQDLWQLLDQAGLRHLNRLEWLISTSRPYSGDDLYVRTPENNPHHGLIKVEAYGQTPASIAEMMKRVLLPLCAGNNIEVNGTVIADSSSRAIAYRLLLPLYSRERARIRARRLQGAQQARAEGRRAGRKRVQTDSLRLRELWSAVQNHHCTAKEAAEKLGISTSTFYRRVRELE